MLTMLGLTFLTAVAAPDSPPLLGAIRWDAWHTPWSQVVPGSDDGPVKAVETSLGPKRYHWRLPFFATVGDDGRARIDGYTQTIVDQEIAFAKAGGLDYWAFLLYESGSAMSQGLSLYLSSEHKQELPFCAIAGANTFGNAAQFPDRMQRVLTLMTEPSYLRVGGRPLLFVFRADDPWIHAWGGPDNARRLFDGFRAACREAELGDPYLVAMNDSVAEGRRIGTILGADAVSAYALSGGGRHGAPYDELTAVPERFWRESAGAGLPLVPLAMAGWDRRPRIEAPVPWERKWQEAGVGMDRYYATPTPQQLADHLETALQFVAAEPELCPARAVLVYAWNEHDEGGWLCPTRGADGRPDTSRLDAIATMKRNFQPRRPVTDVHARLLLSLDAAAGLELTDGRITRWRDRSGEGHDAVAHGPGLSVVDADGRPLLRFGEGENWFEIAGLQASRPVTVIAVSRRLPGTPTGQYGRILSYWDGQSQANGQPADWIAPSWCLPIMAEAPYPVTIHQLTAPRIDGLRIGRSMAKTDFLHADLGEVRIYDDVLSGPELDAVRRQLRETWQIPPVLPPR